MEELAKAAGLSFAFPLTEQFVRRTAHGGLWRFGMTIQLIKMSIEVALSDGDSGNDLKPEHFEKGYKRLSKCDVNSNVYVSKDWHLIWRQVTEKGNLTRTYTLRDA